MRTSLTMCPAFYRSRKRSYDVAQFLGWLDDLVTAGTAGFDEADGIPLLHLVLEKCSFSKTPRSLGCDEFLIRCWITTKKSARRKSREAVVSIPLRAFLGTYLRATRKQDFMSHVGGPSASTFTLRSD